MLCIWIIGLALVALLGAGLIANEIAMNRHADDVMKDTFKKW